jgi:Amino acid permease
VNPWQSLVHERFATAVAFERAMGSQGIVRVIMAAALLSLLKIFNGNFVAASRLLFGLGRRELADTRLAYVHPVNHTPSTAIVLLGIATALLMFAVESLLVPITEVVLAGGAARLDGFLHRFPMHAPTAARPGSRPHRGCCHDANDCDQGVAARPGTLHDLRADCPRGVGRLGTGTSPPKGRSSP